MYRFFKKSTILFMLTLFFAALLSEAKEPINTSKSLKKSNATDPAINRARAYLDKGKLKVGVDNYGVFCGKTSPEGLWGDFQYISDLSLMVGVPGRDRDGNPHPWAVGKKTVFSFQDQDFVERGDDDTYWGATVSEAWFDRTVNYNRVDWEAVEDASLFLHNPQATAGEQYGALGLWTFPEDPYPLIATSDLPETWPLREDEQGNQEHFWPGPWALDPADTTGETVLEGVFVSDQDIYFEFDDRLATRDIDPDQGYPMFVRSTVSAYSYSASISEDIIFFKMFLHNDSEHHYKDMYAGFYFDVDSYNRLASGSYSGRTNDDDMMGYNTEYDYGFIYDLDDNSSGFTDLAYSAVKLLETPKSGEEIDLDGDGFSDIFPGDDLGLTSWHWFDWYFRPGAKDGGLNGPFSGDGETPVQDNKEEIQYKILAGDTSGLSAYDDEHFFHPIKGEGGFVGALNPRFDSVEGLLYDFPEGLDCVFIMGSGPFELAPGDSVPFSFCILMGEDEDDLVTNAKIAQLMYDNNYQGARAPKAPNVIAKEEDRKVTLYWDATSVKDSDIITGYEDFEGFRIYKSTDLGKTWGERYYDEQSRISYWEPIAQFDLDNDIEGFEPLMPHRYLGENTGLSYSFVDEDVMNGVEYLYAVCAYDRGFVPSDPVFDPDNVAISKAINFEVPSLENLLSNSTNLPHIVKAIPHRPASNASAKDLRVEKLPGTIGSGVFNVEVVYPQDVTGHTYKILFDCDYTDETNTEIVPGSQRYTIIDSTLNTVIVDSSKEYSKDLAEPESPPVFDGLRWAIQMATEITVTERDAYWTEGSACTYELTVANFRREVRSDYEFRFIGEDAEPVYNAQDYKDGTETLMFSVPFEAWNTVENQKATILANRGSGWEQGTSLQLHEAYYDQFDDPRTFRFAFDWVEPDSVDPETNKPLVPSVPWEPGDVLVVPVRKPFERGDGFIVTTGEVFNVSTVVDSTIKKVKVVPNPYYVRAGWETDDFVRKIQFTNLPNKCKIHIFNMAAEKVITLEHDSGFDGSANWDLLTSNRQEAAPGLYIYVVEAENGKTETGKFVIIK